MSIIMNVLRRRSGRPNSLSVLTWIGLTIVAVLIFWFLLTELVGSYHVTILAAFAVATVQCGTILLAIRRPLLATALQLLAVAGAGVATELATSQPWPISIPGIFALTGFMAVIGLRQKWTTSAVIWWIAIAVLVVLVGTNPQGFSNSNWWGNDMVGAITATLLALALSVGLGQRRRIREDLLAARRDVELEHAKRQSVEERARIARELHDVVAHSMSIIHMQSMSAPYRLPHIDPAVAKEFDEIARTARTALGEMRQLLGALRLDDGVQLAPQPQVKDIPSLLAGASLAGTHAELSLDPDSHQLSPVLQLTAYRIVQEGLSNIVRHAPNADAWVILDHVRSDTIRVMVKNGPPPVARDGGTGLADSGGLGLRGMRERVLIAGGTLTHDESPEGGFVLEALLPVSEYDLAPSAREELRPSDPQKKSAS